MKVELIVLNDKGPLKNLLDKKIKVINLNKRKLIFAIPSIVKNLKQKKYNSILTSLPHFNIVLILIKLLFGIKSKLIIREANIEYNKFTRKNFNYFFFNLAKKITYPYADKIIALSYSMKDLLSINLKIKRSKIKVIYNPIIDNQNSNLDFKIQNDWFKEKEIPILLAIGRLEYQKNYPLLLKALFQINKFKKTRLIIVGKGKDELQLKRLIDKYNLNKEVLILDYVENPRYLMKNVNIFISVSFWEGGANVLIEALKSQTNIVCSSYPSSFEYLENGKYGEIFENNDLDDLINKIKKSLSYKNKNINEKWKEFTETNFETYLKLMI